MPLSAVAQPRQHAVFFQPVLGQHAERAVVELDGILAFLQGLQQARQRRDLIVELDLAVEIEPVDAGGHFDVDFAGSAIELALRLDVPAGFQQGVRRLGEEPRGQLEIPGLAVGNRGVAEAVLKKQRRRRFFRRPIAQEQAARGGIENAAVLGRFANLLAGIIENDVGIKVLAPPALLGGADLDLRSRHAALLGDAKLLGQFEGRQPRHQNQLAQEFVLPRRRHAQRFLLPQGIDPRRGPVVLQAGGAFLVPQDHSWKQQERLRHRLTFLAAPSQPVT